MKITRQMIQNTVPLVQIHPCGAKVVNTDPKLAMRGGEYWKHCIVEAMRLQMLVAWLRDRRK